MLTKTEVYMRKLILSVFVSFSLVLLHAQDSTLNAYVGTYTFPEGGPVTSVDIKIENGSLVASSTAGSSPLERVSKDTFSLVNYNGKVYFSRDSTKNVSGMKIEVEDTIMEGKKESVDFAIVNYSKELLGKRKCRVAIWTKIWQVRLEGFLFVRRWLCFWPYSYYFSFLLHRK